MIMAINGLHLIDFEAFYQGMLSSHFSSLLRLHHRQSRHEERSLVTLNERQVTKSGDDVALTPTIDKLKGAMSYFAPVGVRSRLCGITTLRSFCLDRSKINLGSVEK